ncbi:MAG: hypothetical protein NVV73_07050 [Cellvibrionaceae bacterium]|nr:hypothetical protein [Cellvibrionaceae bacterium]
MNLSDAKCLIELLHPGFVEIARTAMDRVAEATGEELEKSRKQTDGQLEEIRARLEILEKND